MDKDIGDREPKKSPSLRESESDQSFVGKFKNHVSGIISNTPLSKWFRRQNVGSPVRRRDEDDEFYDLQPPSKKTKLPELSFGETLSPINNVNNSGRVTFKPFPEPVAGPSGYSARKFHSSAVSVRDTYKNGDLIDGGDKDSDSEESTSGYSSGRVGSKEMASQESSKQTSPLENSPTKSRSLFTKSTTGRILFPDRTAAATTPSQNTSLRSRLPSYNASSIPSSSFEDRTLSTKRIINSPFYSGRTIYGGASAKIASVKPPHTLPSIQIKPVNKSTADKRDLQLGKTARRILDALEQYSTPVRDAKKIPVASKRGILSKYTAAAHPYSNRELLVPSVTDLLKMKQKTRLQDSTESVRQIAATSKSVLNEPAATAEYKIPDQENYTGKMKSKICSTRPKVVKEDETVPELRLNPVALPIKQLPKFDLAPDSAKSNGEFKFSAPLVLGECSKPLKGSNEFKFSEPLCKKRRSNGANLSLTDKFKPAAGTWECSMCLIRNEPGKVKCAACETPKSDKVKVVASTFGDKFKPPSDTWECTACMVRNKNDAAKCVACQSPKGGKSATPAKTTPTPVTSASGFAGPLTMSTVGTWECMTCMVRNVDKLQKCVACQAPKVASAQAPVSAPAPITAQAPVSAPAPITAQAPVSAPWPISAPAPALCFGIGYQKPSDEWECQICLVRNKLSVNKCPCCNAPKPGAEGAVGSTPNENAPPIFNFGVVKNTASNFSFGMPAKYRKTPPTAEDVKNFTYKTHSATPTTTAPPAPVSFSFGLPKAATDTEPKPAAAAPKEPPKPTTQDSVKPVAAPPKPEEKASPEPPKANPLLKSGEKLPEKAKPAPAGFSFGLPVSSPQKNKIDSETDDSPAKRSKPAAEPSKSSTATFNFKPAAANGDINKILPFNKAKEDVKSTSLPAFSFSPAKTAPITTAPAPASSSSQIVAPLTTTVQTNSPKVPVFKFASSFGGEPPKQPPLNNGLSFTAPSFAPTTTTTPTPSFGSSTTTTNSNTEIKPFGFGAQQQTPKSSNFSFGSSEPPPAAKTPSFSFNPPTNSAVAATAENKPAFSFGSNSAESTKPSAFAFGQSTTGFGQPTTPAPSAASLFGQPAPGAANPFGQAATTPTPAFGQASAVPSPFGQSAPSFNFGGAKTGTAEQAPSSGVTEGLFNFGSAAAAASSSQTTGFSFGAANAGPAPTQNSGFNFGGSTAAPSAAPGGGFSFSGAPPTFDVNAKPSFNFTGGTGVTAFSAQPQTDGGHQPRKIKKAIRRTQVR